jgi:hypothetical protein
MCIWDIVAAMTGFAEVKSICLPFMHADAMVRLWLKARGCSDAW